MGSMSDAGMGAGAHAGASAGSSAAPGRRRRLDADDRRAAILDAARRAFASATYAEVSIAQIAEAAGASPALVHHYVGSKAQLYETVVGETLADLAERVRAADASVPDGAPVRERVRATTLVYLDHVASRPRSWSARLVGAEEPAGAVRMRLEARERYVDALGALLGTHGWTRHEYALWGYFGFLDQACLAWAGEGCPDDHRHALVEAALGALEGALGDWGV